MHPRVAAWVVLLKMLSVATAAPVETTDVNSTVRPPQTADCNDEASDVYDQRQNGTENYRIHVNGMVVLVAPADAVLQAAQLGTLPMGPESDVSNIAQQPLKPKPKPPTATDKIPNDSNMPETAAIHPKERVHSTFEQSTPPGADHRPLSSKNNLKLLNLLHMFRSIRHDAE